MTHFNSTFSVKFADTSNPYWFLHISIPIHILVYNQIFFLKYDSFLSMQMFYHLNALRYFYEKDIRSFDKLSDNKIWKRRVLWYRSNFRKLEPWWFVCAFVAQSCLTLCEPMDCSPPGSSVHGILQTRILEWVTIPFSRGSSQPRDQTWVSCTAGRFFTIWAIRPHPGDLPQV